MCVFLEFFQVVPNWTSPRRRNGNISTLRFIFLLYNGEIGVNTALLKLNYPYTWKFMCEGINFDDIFSIVKRFCVHDGYFFHTYNRIPPRKYRFSPQKRSTFEAQEIVCREASKWKTFFSKWWFYCIVYGILLRLKPDVVKESLKLLTNELCCFFSLKSLSKATRSWRNWKRFLEGVLSGISKGRTSWRPSDLRFFYSLPTHLLSK